MIRKAHVFQVHPDKHDEYEKRHHPIWEELTEVLKSHGVLSYSIYLDAPRNLLFCYVEIEDEERWDAIASTPVCQRWWAYMKDVMVSNPDNSPVAQPLKEIYHLD